MVAFSAARVAGQSSEGYTLPGQQHRVQFRQHGGVGRQRCRPAAAGNAGTPGRQQLERPLQRIRGDHQHQFSGCLS